MKLTHSEWVMRKHNSINANLHIHRLAKWNYHSFPYVCAAYLFEFPIPAKKNHRLPHCFLIPNVSPSVRIGSRHVIFADPKVGHTPVTEGRLQKNGHGNWVQNGWVQISERDGETEEERVFQQTSVTCFVRMSKVFFFFNFVSRQPPHE